MAVVTREDEALEALQERMRGARSGEVEVLDVRLDHDLDEEMDEYVRITLVLSDPPPGRETWPLVSVQDLTRRTYVAADGLEIKSRLVVTRRTREDYEEPGWGEQ
jgi:hypothetical protein